MILTSSYTEHEQNTIHTLTHTHSTCIFQRVFVCHYLMLCLCLSPCLLYDIRVVPPSEQGTLQGSSSTLEIAGKIIGPVSVAAMFPKTSAIGYPNLVWWFCFIVMLPAMYCAFIIKRHIPEAVLLEFQQKVERTRQTPYCSKRKKTQKGHHDTESRDVPLSFVAHAERTGEDEGECPLVVHTVPAASRPKSPH